MMRDYLTEHGTDADVSECLGEIFDSIGESDAAEGEKAYFKAAAALGIDRPVTRKRHRAVSWFAGIAAALAVLIAGGATALLVDGSRDVEWNEIKVPAGQTRELVLADGTVLQLNAGSRVTYPASFRRCRTREIFAEGEIYAEDSISRHTETPAAWNFSFLKGPWNSALCPGRRYRAAWH